MNDSSMTLSELNFQVKQAISSQLPDAYWVRAETSDVRRNQNGHCYLEFVEKDPVSHAIIAKARGIIWSNIFQFLSIYFQEQTGLPFSSGLNVMVKISVEFHELYGYSLNVVDIDPVYTVGDIARNRQMVIKQLEDEGIINLNKELFLPELTNRIAVISSPTAAGYGDFCDQLDKNTYGIVFYQKLFPAKMQGDQTESSIIEALDKIYQYRELFDCVVVVRGGGATSELSYFDSYELASNIAQFPLPIISGIGHERDVTVVDYVAHTRAKTPTAVAEFLIAKALESMQSVYDLQDRLVSETQNLIQDEWSNVVLLSRGLIKKSQLFISDNRSSIAQLSLNLNHVSKNLIQVQKHQLTNNEQYIKMVSPENILKRGYTLTLKNGKIITSTEILKINDEIETVFWDGKVQSEVINKQW